MKNFTFQNPTKIVFGENVINQLGEEVKSVSQKVLLVYGGGSIKRNGVYDQVINSLNEYGIEFVEFSGVKSNPVLSHTKQGIALAKAEKVDAIIAVGGGSVIDECKTIAAGVCINEDPWGFFSGEIVIEKALPLFTVLTLAATGSEMNSGFVITNEDTKQKYAAFSPHCFPKVSFLDPTATYSVPANYTAFSGVDAISHLFEGYFTHGDEWAPIQDSYVEGLVKTIMESTERILKDPKDYQARGTMMWAATLALNGLGYAGVGPVEYPAHMLEHTLSALYDIPHGAGLAIIQPAWMQWASEKNPAKFAVFARNVFDINEEDDLLAAESGVEAFRSWIREINAPVTFLEAGIPEDEIGLMVENALTTAKDWGMSSYDGNVIKEIYKLCSNN